MFIEYTIIAYNRMMTLECVMTRVIREDMFRKGEEILFKELDLLEYRCVFMKKNTVEKPMENFNKTTISNNTRKKVVVHFYYKSEDGSKKSFSRVFDLEDQDRGIDLVLSEIGDSFEDFRISEWFGDERIEQILSRHWSAK